LVSWWIIELPVAQSYLVATKDIRFGVEFTESIFVDRYIVNFLRPGPQTCDEVNPKFDNKTRLSSHEQIRLIIIIDHVLSRDLLLFIGNLPSPVGVCYALEVS
jgi:hypothetical protein